ncbi:metal-dependent hydrolase family protein [Ornithinimicrobium cavernae]|uniref:metal-dependent hydrolase family protein n=1 Tax=Ornithinimicrobium cavernae TaxID=2666047 RepID=UPI000D691463|nr:amidohydrolase family protein [Ornithinimicrobium cavernae]
MALILRRASTWDGESPDLRTADVVCADGMVRSVEPAGSVRPMPDDQVIEAEGSTLLPGLIDGHVHLVWSGGSDPADIVERDGEQVTAIRAAANARAQLLGGVTTVADLGSNWDIAIAVSRAVTQGHIEGPRILAAGRTVAMTGGHDPFWVNACDGVDAVIRGVREQVFLGAALVKTAATGGVYGRAEGEVVGASELTPEELTAMASEAHRRGVRVAAHALGAEGISNAVGAGIDIIEHGVYLTEETAAMMAANGTVLCPTLAVYRSLAEGGGPAYAAAKAADVVQAHGEAVRMALEAGVPVIAGTDAGSPGMPHPSLGAELAALHACGMSPVEVLRAATSRAADAFGISGGRISPGAPADLILVDGDPLSDPVAATQPSVAVCGQRVVHRR